MTNLTKPTRQDVVDYCLKTGLIERCVGCQISKVPLTESQNEEDLIQDMWVWLMTYDENKLLNAYTHNHLNALITQTVVNNVFSKQSPFWTRYHRQSSREDEITPAHLNITTDEKL